MRLGTSARYTLCCAVSPSGIDGGIAVILRLLFDHFSLNLLLPWQLLGDLHCILFATLTFKDYLSMISCIRALVDKVSHYILL